MRRMTFEKSGFITGYGRKNKEDGSGLTIFATDVNVQTYNSN